MAPPRLNILHAIHDFLPRHRAGSEIYASNLCRELALRHHVTVVCAEFDPSRRHGQVTWRVHEGVPVVELVNNWVTASFTGTYRSPLIRERLKHVLDVVQPDVLHVHNLLNLSFDLPRDARALGIPVVATVHDYTLFCPAGGQRIHHAEQHVCEVIETDRCTRCFQESVFNSKRTWGAAQASPFGSVLQPLARAARRTVPKLAMRLADAVAGSAAMRVTRDEISERLMAGREAMTDMELIVAPSQSLADELVGLGAPAARIRVSDYGFPSPGPRPVRTPGDSLRIGYVGTLVWHKGVHVAIEALRLLASKDCELRIFGDPATSPGYTADLRSRAAGLPVQFMGAFDADQVARVYAEIDVLVVPSLWLENSPLVIHEAFMAGVPVLGSRIGGIPDLVRDGWNGLLFDAASPAALARSVQRLVDDRGLLAALASRMPTVKSIEEDAQDWESRYAQVMARRQQQ